MAATSWESRSCWAKLSAAQAGVVVVLAVQGPVQQQTGGVAAVLGQGVDVLLGGIQGASFGAEGLAHPGVQIVPLVDAVEHGLRHTHALDLLEIGLLAAVVVDILLALLFQGLPVGVGQGHVPLPGPLADHGVQLHRLQGVLLGIGPVGHAVGQLRIKVQVRHVGRQILAVVGHPVQILLGVDGLAVDGQQLRVRAGCRRPGKTGRRCGGRW